MTTPLARLGTFLFPTQGHRVSAPAPQSPHEPSKRRSAVAACDSPPRCRRRLSFADVDVVIEYPPSPVDVTPALREHAQALKNSPSQERIAKWDEIAQIATAPAKHSGVDEPVLRQAFISVFEQENSSEEVTAAVTALHSVIEAAPVPLGQRDFDVVNALLNAVIAHPGHPPLVEAVAALVLREDWGRTFAGAVRQASKSLTIALLSAIKAPNVEARTWVSALQLLAVCAESCQRSAMEENDAMSKDVSLELSKEKVEAVLGSFDCLADRNAKCTESALRALRVLLADSDVAAAFLAADASAIVLDISALHAKNLDVQHACISVLVALSSPRVLQFAPPFHGSVR